MTDRELIKNCTEDNALSFNEIKDMSQDELDNLMSICFHEGKLRTYEKGIFNLNIQEI